MTASRPGGIHGQLWDAAGEALAGYPLQSLLELGTSCDATGEDHSQRLVMLTLQNWISSLNQELKNFPPADTEVLVQIKQRVKGSRDALQRIAYSLQNEALPGGARLH
ncbi:MAG: hypothetical protein JOY60_10380 [Burkholderiaceae bacterium]|nr:hypothetical protein [Burkholderiaceae bacterium]